MKKVSIKQIIVAAALSGASSFCNAYGVYYSSDYSSNYYTQLADPGSECRLISGNNSRGVIIAGEYENRTIKYTTSYNSGTWNTLKDPNMLVTHLAGENSAGPLIAGGDGFTVKYLNSYSQNIWKTLARTPFKVESLTGDNYSGPVISNGKQIAFLNSYGANRWTIIHTPQFPNGDIAGISGNNRSGIVAFSDEEDSSVMYLNNYSDGNWISLPTPKVGKIVEIAGNNENGPIIRYEDGSVWYMPSYAQKKWFPINYYGSYNMGSITGENRAGIAFCGQ